MSHAVLSIVIQLCVPTGTSKTRAAAGKTTTTSSSEEEFVKIGDKIVNVMDKVPVVIGVKVEEGVVNMMLDQSGAK